MLNVTSHCFETDEEGNDEAKWVAENWLIIHSAGQHSSRFKDGDQSINSSNSLSLDVLLVSRSGAHAGTHMRHAPGGPQRRLFRLDLQIEEEIKEKKFRKARAKQKTRKSIRIQIYDTGTKYEDFKR